MPLQTPAVINNLLIRGWSSWDLMIRFASVFAAHLAAHVHISLGPIYFGSSFTRATDLIPHLFSDPYRGVFHDYKPEHPSRPRRLGRRVLLGRRYRAPASRRLQRHRPAVPGVLAGR